MHARTESKKRTLEHSPHKKAIEYRWIYKVKYNANGTINCYKVGRIAKGHTQTHNIDYEENFAPAAKMIIIKTAIALAR